MDTNDNLPMFGEIAYSFDLWEDAQRGAQVGAVSATDADLGLNRQVSYSVLSDWANNVFSLNPQTGVFTLTSHLDYEQVRHETQFLSRNMLPQKKAFFLNSDDTIVLFCASVREKTLCKV